MELLGDGLPEAGTAVTSSDEFAQLSATFDAMSALELARQAEDSAPPARRDEDKLAIALDRATLAPAAMFSNAQAAAPGLCGPDDGFGRCSSAFHSITCAHGSDAGAGAAEFSQALADFGQAVQLANPPAGLIHLTDDSGNPAGALPDATVELAYQAGQDMGLYRSAQADPDVRALAKAIGLR